MLFGGKAIDASSAYSTAEKASDAIAEAVQKIRGEIGEPDWCYLSTTVNYPLETLTTELQDSFPHGVKLCGETSSLGVITPEGFIRGPNNKSLVVLGVTTDKVDFGVGYCKVKDAGRKAGREAITSAIKDAGRPHSAKPTLIYMTGTPAHEEEVIEGIEAVIGRDVPIFGGSAGDDEIKGRWRAFANEEVIKGGVALTALFTDRKIGYEYRSGYPQLEASGTVTKAEGRQIYEIDGKPVAEVYNEWTGGELEDEIASGESILGPATFWPLARRIRGKKREYWVTVHPARFHTEGSLEVFAEIPEGERVWVLRGNAETLLERPMKMTKAALSKANTRGRVGFGLITFCAGTMFPIREEIDKSIKKVAELIEAPFAGAFTLGEQGFIKGYGSIHGNLMASTVVVSQAGKKEFSIF